VPEAVLAEIGRDLAEGVLGRARPDYRRLLAGAALSVSQCGYNTATDLLATGTAAVLVPFEAGTETEQRLRAERLAARGLARVLPEAELTASRLIHAVDAQRAEPLPEPHGIDLGGAQRSVAIVEDLLADHRGRRRGTRPTRPGLDVLRRALDGAAEQGRRVSFLWRDDDAVASTPALDRLIGLGEAHHAPILLAAIPAGIEPSLGRRLETAQGVGVAVHGLAHRDHAPVGEKPAEFGAHRPATDLLADAAAGLRIARERLPASILLPVFVPPWNRIAPALAAALPDLGYCGLSAVPGPAIPGLVRADATLDPVDWRGTRSLRDPEVLLHDLADGISRDPLRLVGLLTHHRVHDAALWTFVADLLSVMLAHPATEILSPRRVFDRVAMDSDSRTAKSLPPQIARTG
jgi:hypothetical protein